MIKTIELEFQGHPIGQFEVEDSVTTFDLAVPQYPNYIKVKNYKYGSSLPETEIYKYYKLRFEYHRLRKTRTNLIHVFRFVGVVNDITIKSEINFNPSKRNE